MTAVPGGIVRAENFATFDTEVGAPSGNQVLVGLRRLGLNAGLAHRLGGEGTAYGPAIDVGAVPASDAVVEVLESDVEEFQPGDLAVGMLPWCTAAVIDADELRKIDHAEPSEDLDVYLTVLGHVGFTAYTGLIHVGDVQSDDVVYVSGAAGGVGSCVVQFAKARGATVIGVASSQDKVALLTDVLGADHAINRHDGPAVDLLRKAAPGGIDLYYDNVGGEQLVACRRYLAAFFWCAGGGGLLPLQPARIESVMARTKSRPVALSAAGREWLMKGSYGVLPGSAGTPGTDSDRAR